ncbi:hypothetical protein N9Z83_03140, partial [Akkermansiaceae bacterium]|nr:hypothetical protein [Akkermansiaceae bacterium]
PSGDPEEGMTAYLRIKGSDGELAPLRAFYRALSVEVSETMEPGSWRQINEVPLDGEGPYEAASTMPLGLKMFTRVIGVEPDEID